MLDKAQRCCLCDILYRLGDQPCDQLCDLLCCFATYHATYCVTPKVSVCVVHDTESGGVLGGSSTKWR